MRVWVTAWANGGRRGSHPRQALQENKALYRGFHLRRRQACDVEVLYTKDPVNALLCMGSMVRKKLTG